MTKLKIRLICCFKGHKWEEREKNIYHCIRCSETKTFDEFLSEYVGDTF